MKEEVEKYYNELVSSLDDMIYLTLVLREIIDSVEDEKELVELSLELMYLAPTFSYKRDLVLRFKKELDRLIDEYGVEIKQIDSNRLNEVIERIINKTK